MSTSTEKQAVVNFGSIVGGWSPYEKLTAKEKAIFQEATRGLLGVQYTPELVSKQVVNGTNYRFKCIASPVTPKPLRYHVIIQIYAPLKGEPFITHIFPEL